MNRKVFKNGIVLTIDQSIGNFTKADVLVEGSKIVEVKPNIEVSDCEIIDASNMIVMPGLVDTHRHTWESLVRNIGTDWSLQKYLASIYYGNIGSLRRPQDDYIANLLGALEALDSGVTTLLDSSMIMSNDHTEEMIRGLQESGVRGVFAHGCPGDEEYWNRESMLDNGEDARRIKEKHFSSEDQLLTMGLAIRGPEFSSWDTSVKEIQLARELGVVCTMHLGFGTWGSIDRSIEKLNKAGLLGPDLNFVHMNAVSPEEMRMIAANGGSISVTPEIEMMMGHGYPATGLCLENGVRPTIGVDVVTSTGGDMFAQMKFALQAERARVNGNLIASGEMPEPLHISANDMLEFATIDGAKALMLEDKVGSLTPGKKADIIMVRTSDLNIFPVNDPVGTVVQCTHTGNVDSVFVDGKAIKRNGEMVGIDLDKIRKQAIESRNAILEKYGMPDNVVV
ncbi:cytosine/adenosine deaminase-related metal-dependent hydrolase [Virgibacillus natechei]|uniref:Cytosine/adenosine deaminase-related metal-dependent hydrolase n=1 Tax=Virgibacillus natechei TaxID=1216297 RepID=A0ABS4IIK8_9BACI|nr:amidohydrolase family protein [Virgibacillus natechei]MBP1970788.1 cytosine/adenosine deaminase-related metal-dependent hydrolase [Virgibacillus natechei]UZD12311.1 amidohydrolase family protein [Virgibacillus natechei]